MNIPVEYIPSSDPAQIGTWHVELQVCPDGCGALLTDETYWTHGAWHEGLASRLECLEGTGA